MISERSFKQRFYFTRYHFRLGESGVSVSESAIVSHRKYDVPFESIGEAPMESSVSSKPRLWATIILTSFAVITGVLELTGGDVEPGTAFTWVFLALLAGGSFLLSRRDYIVFRSRGSEPLVFMKDLPSKAELEEFIALMQRKKRAYLEQKYLEVPSDAGAVDVLTRLAWLYERGVIDESEFRILKADLIRRLSPELPADDSVFH